MNAFVTSAIVFASLFGATLLGMRLRAGLPEDHLSPEAKESVRIAMGSVATMAALVLGLLVASMNGSYDAEKNEVTQMAAKIDFLDCTLSNYGPETKECRSILKVALERALTRMWPDQKAQHPDLDPNISWTAALPKAIEALAPETDAQRSFKSQAVKLTNELGQMRWLLYEETESSVSVPMLVIVATWLTVIFLSIGLFAPAKSTVIIALLLAALSVSGAIFLILELDLPFDGLIQISPAPLHNALEHLGR